MALEQMTFNIGALEDSLAGGKNYVSGQIYEVFNTNNTLASIFSDAGGTTPINQDGISNVSNGDGEVNFYIAVGIYYFTVGAKRRDFEAGIGGQLIDDLTQAYEFATVAAYKAFATAFPVGKIINTLEFATGTGGGASHTVISGTAPADGVFASNQVSQSIDITIEESTTYIVSFGAVGNNIANDTAAITAAYNRTPIGGTLLGDLSKTFLLTGLNIAKPITVRELIVHADTDASNALLHVTSSNVFLDRCKTIIVRAELVASDCSGVLVEGLGLNVDTFNASYCEFDGSKNDNYVLPYFHSGLLFVDADNVYVRNCTVRNTHKEGMIISSGNNASFLGCNAYSTGFSGIGSTGGPGFKHSGLLINNCYVEDAGASAITANSINSVVTGCHTKNNFNNNGINIGHPHATEQYAVNCVVSGNTVEIESTHVPGGDIHGIRVNSSFGTIIADNTVKGGDILKFAIYSDTAESITIDGNSIYDCLEGIRVSHDRDPVVDITPDTVIISNNTILNSFITAITVKAGRYVTVTGNVINHFARGGSGFATGIFFSLSSFVVSKMETVNISGNIIADGPYCIRFDTSSPPCDGAVISGNSFNQYSNSPVGKDGVAVYSGGGNVMNNAPHVESITFPNAATSVVYNNANIDPDFGLPEFSFNGNWIYTDQLTTTSITAGSVEFRRNGGGVAETIKVIIR
ncbi:MAG: right-handed parallel beta-helix repeat-containing protein [Oleispira sp.]|nr:right-handed parallel beta-helix repeat-containing protein [Oleispira sp.]